MLFLITVNFRQGVSQEESKAAAQVLRDRLLKPNPGVKIHSAVADIGGGGEIHIIADLTERAMKNVKRTLEFRALPAVERMEYTPGVSAQEALDAYLELEFVAAVSREMMEELADSV